MGIIVCRVDDRLIHGQVATNWIRVLKIQAVIIVDDKVSSNQTQISILKMATPSEVKVYVQDKRKFIEKFDIIQNLNINVMIIFVDLFTPSSLLDENITLKSINIGGIRHAPGKKQYGKSLFLSPNEEEIIWKLYNSGTEIEYRQLARDTKVDVISLLKKGG